MTDRYWFIKNGIPGKYWDVLRWGNVPLAALALTIMQGIVTGSACPIQRIDTVALVACWDLCVAVMMRPLVGAVLDVQADREGVVLTTFCGRRRAVPWARIGRIRVTFARTKGPCLVIHETCGATQNRYYFSISHPGPGIDAASFLLSQLAALAPARLGVQQLPASWRDIGVFNAWFLGASVIGLGVAAVLGRYHFEAGVLVPVPAAVLLTVAVRLRRRVSIEVERGVMPNWDSVPRSCRAWVRALVSRTEDCLPSR